MKAAPLSAVVVFPRPRDWWLLAAALGVLFTICLGSRGLNDPDEGRYANIAMAMARLTRRSSLFRWGADRMAASRAVMARPYAPSCAMSGPPRAAAARR